MARRIEVVGTDTAQPHFIVAYPDDQLVTWHGGVWLRHLGQSSWICSSPATEVPGATGAPIFCRGSRGPISIANAEKRAERLPVELFGGSGLTTWKAAEAAGPGRYSPAATMQGSGGRRFLPLAGAPDPSRPLDFDVIGYWWTIHGLAQWAILATPCTSWSQARAPVASLQGPGASDAVLGDGHGLGRELVTGRVPRLVAARLHLDSPHLNEHSLLCSAPGPMEDGAQLDLVKCALAVLPLRRPAQLERAVRACPRPPNFTGLGTMFEMNWSDHRGLPPDEFTGRFAAVAEADIHDTMRTRLLQGEVKQTDIEEIDADDSLAAGGRRRRRMSA